MSEASAITTGPIARPAGGDRTYKWRRLLEALLAPLVALLAAVLLFSIFLLTLGQSPLDFLDLVWRGAFEQMLIGPTEERWDLCFIAQYPTVAAFVAMIRDPVYREAVKHRQAGVEDSRLIRLAPGAVGVGFG